MVPAVLNLGVGNNFSDCQSSMRGGLIAQGLKARATTGLVVTALPVALMNFGCWGGAF